MSTLSAAPVTNLYQTVVTHALPRLCDVIINDNDKSYASQHAIDLVTALAAGAPESGLGDGFVARLAPSLFSSLAVAEDRDVIQVCLKVN